MEGKRPREAPVRGAPALGLGLNKKRRRRLSRAARAGAATTQGPALLRVAWDARRLVRGTAFAACGTLTTGGDDATGGWRWAHRDVVFSGAARGDGEAVDEAGSAAARDAQVERASGGIVAMDGSDAGRVSGGGDVPRARPSDGVAVTGSDVPPKYWAKRSLLWSRWSDSSPAICMDVEGWYSVTPERVAQHMADVVAAACAARGGGRDVLRAMAACGGGASCGSDDGGGSSSGNSGGGCCGTRVAAAVASGAADGAPAAPDRRSLTVLDVFAGCGGNVVALARHPAVAHVIAVDVDAARLGLARGNAAAYGVEGRVTWVAGDAVEVLAAALEALAAGGDASVATSAPRAGAPARMAFGRAAGGAGGVTVAVDGAAPCALDAVLLAPPWGGMDYAALGVAGVRDVCVPSPAAARLRAALAALGAAELTVGAAADARPRGASAGDPAPPVDGGELWRAAALAAPVTAVYLPRAATEEALVAAAADAAGAAASRREGAESRAVAGAAFVERCGLGYGAAVPLAVCAYLARA